jgi:hypothetical protein
MAPALYIYKTLFLELEFYFAMPTTSKYHEKSFRVSGIRLWNSLPALFVGAPAFPLSKQILEINIFPPYVRILIIS